MSTITPAELGRSVLTEFDGKEIKPGVFVIGDITWYDRPYKEEKGQMLLPWISGSWRCLADVCGCLCVIEVSPYILTEGKEHGDQI